MKTALNTVAVGRKSEALSDALSLRGVAHTITRVGRRCALPTYVVVEVVRVA